jgi:hypothetical protein
MLCFVSIGSLVFCECWISDVLGTLCILVIQCLVLHDLCVLCEHWICGLCDHFCFSDMMFGTYFMNISFASS